MKNFKTQGFVLIDVDVVALNNAGKSTSTQADNGVATKKINKNGRDHTYVSGQAWRFWWRNALLKDHNWSMSPIIRTDKVAFTQADPFSYADDDIFGYMKATTEEKRDDDGNVILKKNGKPDMIDATVTRVSPLKNSALISVGSVQTQENWSNMMRQEGPAVPFTKEEYSAVMKGMFSLDLEQVGTFAAYNKTGFKNLSEKTHKDAIAKGATVIDDAHLPTKTGVHQQIRIDRETRIKRVVDTISALKTISGGAMQTNNMADVTPKFIILATTNSGNHPFSHVATGGKSGRDFHLNVDGLMEVIDEYKTNWQGKIFIGHRSGFLNEDAITKLQALKVVYKDIVEIMPVNAAIDAYVEQLKNQMP